MMVLLSFIRVNIHPTVSIHIMNPANNLSHVTGNESQTMLSRSARCPGCGDLVHFTFLGEQRWPEKVAQALGVPTVVKQWLCSQCHTTVTEPDMQ